MTQGFPDLDGLPHDQLLAVAHDYMLTGMLCGRSLGPINALGGEVPDTESLPIDQWMGASPVYTHRLRALMGIEGDDVAAIMKALQLDVGFVHGYMDVVYRIDSPDYGEFWLLHCGALIDVEPFGEERVHNMCHTIEDPTFDATALATNPKARIRPIHRPPRVPADRHPHCHWTLKIDEANEPVGRIPHTDRVGGLPLASVPNAVGHGRAGGDMHDYRGPFDPGFRLRQLTTGALAAVAREFQVQSHLLCASDHMTVADRSGEAVARATSDEGWRTFAWILGERLAKAIDLGTGTDALVRALELTAAFPPGFDRTVAVDGDTLRVEFVPTHDGVLDPDHPGWCGSLARGATTGVDGTIGALGFRATAIDGTVDGDAVRIEATIVPRTEEDAIPDFVQLGRSIGQVAAWDFGQLVQIRT